MGNSSSDGEFAEHYAYLVREKFRLTKPGRLTAVHCSDLPMTKWKDGAVGIPVMRNAEGGAAARDKVCEVP